jgi:hypothetical protein
VSTNKSSLTPRSLSWLLGDFFPAAYNCPHEIQRLGALGDGGKWVCGISRVEEKPDCIVYSFGALHLKFSAQ